ncbi:MULTISPECIES: FxsA family protein [Virgibacillus]|uniref:Exlusion protein FxsA n=1 Tax=Virgibacillus pantothenticus TaxID=1473 RepID=A0A0L0QQ99_VIRPA|nr:MULTISPECIES: FxsA family protein [Virgibacillus]API90825.1 membrane protein FxsA [Virgibacillus sp. 6R]KNE20772.1 exlusion protein FxsA [Virgibacillus pantothenticus]MBS7426742.1 FxsA family protein [Virgibacillus sp. 19R1-5]MBU8566069.1 FxsA family protein [Virgibacillus pantothenticus]MBU8600635.1 FxsA family protein [Virgibacillus pantothenticus]
MKWFLLIAFVLSALEIGVFVWVGGWIGPWWVVGLVLLTGAVGFYLAKQQGIETWNRAQLSMQRGEVPTSYIIDGICILIGAVLLVTPGFISDAVGFLLVIPTTRILFKQRIESLIKHLIKKRTIIYRRW